MAAGLDIRLPRVEWNTVQSTVEVSFYQLQGYELAVLAMPVLFVGYGMAGGLGAAVATDFVQGLLTILFSFLLLPEIFFRGKMAKRKRNKKASKARKKVC